MPDKKVALVITTAQKVQGRREEETTEAQGSYYEKEGAAHLVYKEGDRTTHIRIAPPLVHVHRLGALSGDLWFSEGAQREIRYTTPYGNVLLDVETHKIRWIPGRELYIRYNILSDGQRISLNEMNLKIREIKE